jgi:hypothetical protein
MGWVPYERRQDFLLESEIGVTMHFEHVETAFSFRTRVLDYIWAGLPVVGTEGDEFARWIVERGTGAIVRYEDPDSIAEAVSGLLLDKSRYERSAEAVRMSRSDFTWERARAPLPTYCASPWRAGDSIDRPQLPKELLSSAIAPRDLLPRLRFFMRREGSARLTLRLARAFGRRVQRMLTSPFRGRVTEKEHWS